IVFRGPGGWRERGERDSAPRRHVLVRRREGNGRFREAMAGAACGAESGELVVREEVAVVAGGGEWSVRLRKGGGPVTRERRCAAGAVVEVAKEKEVGSAINRMLRRRRSRRACQCVRSA